VKQHPSVSVCVDNVSDAVWSKRVWHAILFLAKQHKMHGLYIVRNRGAVLLVEMLSLVGSFQPLLNLRKVGGCTVLELFWINVQR
jgi:hypothetical protein